MQQVEVQCVSVGGMGRRYSSLRSIRMRPSSRRRPMGRLEVHGAEREVGDGMGALEVVDVDQSVQRPTKWQNVERAGVSQGQSFLLIISISTTLNR